MVTYRNRFASTRLQISLAALILLLMPISASAGTIGSKLSGLHCASEGETCPTDKLDPHLAVEADFVVLPPGGAYYSITNLVGVFHDPRNLH